MVYPATWREFEGGEGSFLFYNPDEWTGNFRISAYRGKPGYGREAVRQELAENRNASSVRVGKWDCAYSSEQIEEEGAHYTVHLWVAGEENLAFECSFTTVPGAAVAEAEQVIASLEVRKEGVKYPAEVIPVRLSEIYQINEAYDWVGRTVEERLKSGFQGWEDDIARMQQIVAQGDFSPKKKEVWMAFGIVLCIIFAGEAEGWEWRTLIDGNREAPVLVRVADGVQADPMKLVWSRVRAGERPDLTEAYQGLWNL